MNNLSIMGLFMNYAVHALHSLYTTHCLQKIKVFTVYLRSMWSRTNDSIFLVFPWSPWCHCISHCRLGSPCCWERALLTSSLSECLTLTEAWWLPWPGAVRHWPSSHQSHTRRRTSAHRGQSEIKTLHSKTTLGRSFIRTFSPGWWDKMAF